MRRPFEITIDSDKHHICMEDKPNIGSRFVGVPIESGIGWSREDAHKESATNEYSTGRN